MVFVAGATNVMQEDGVTPMWKRYAKTIPTAERMYTSHKACIDAIVATGVSYSVFCPGLMKSMGDKSNGVPDSLNIRINRPSNGDGSVSYEDAAYAMVYALDPAFDGQLFTASTPAMIAKAAKL